jgi:signal transduction histidine kinase
MVLEEQALLLKRREVYQKDVLLTPRGSYLMAIFSLGIFIFSFRKINRDKNRIAQTESFIKNILKSTSNIISHFEPIYSKKNEIVDFTILFTNDRIQDVTGAIPANIVGQPVSKVYPFLFENNVFDIWKECVEEKKARSYETNYVFGGERMWFDSTVIPLQNGITVTARNNTNERVSQEKQAYLNNQLQIQNSILNQVKSIARVGNYMWSLQTDTVEFSENLYRLLGWEANGFQPSLEKYASFIHPEDIVRFNKSISEIRKTKTSKDFSYRITTKDGNERHFYSRYHFYEKGGDGMMIVVIQDITKEIWNKLKLKSKNLELERSNTELQSFNRVASHDLQEPLRKIQIFISRIYDGEVQQLSEKGKEYLNKINFAANRMQSLIRYLLTYSRVNDVLQDFEQIDLNGILEKVLEDQAVTITETNTQLIYRDLPIIKGLRFQMEQLFNNLISNCIKYGPLDGNPIITITAEVHPNEKREEGLLKTRKAFHKITIRDNGIGFEQEYAEKIFELFQRLHQKNEYSGSGIGLAICKKIVENHNGYIRATGKPDQGAAFYIYLPL